LVSNRPSGVAKQGSSPHVQLNPGESFPMEWRIGHSSHKKMTYFAIIRAKDEAKLALADRYALQDYLNRAPSTAAMAHFDVDPYRVDSRRSSGCALCAKDQR
jgi:hypothetical protein